jgi:hypothetical protein
LWGARLEFKFWGSRLRIEELGFRVQGSGFRVQDSGFRVQGFGCRVLVRVWIEALSMAPNSNFERRAVDILLRN